MSGEWVEVDDARGKVHGRGMGHTGSGLPVCGARAVWINKQEVGFRFGFLGVKTGMGEDEKWAVGAFVGCNRKQASGSLGSSRKWASGL